MLWFQKALRVIENGIFKSHLKVINRKYQQLKILTLQYIVNRLRHQTWLPFSEKQCLLAIYHCQAVQESNVAVQITFMSEPLLHLISISSAK